MTSNKTQDRIEGLSTEFLKACGRTLDEQFASGMHVSGKKAASNGEGQLLQGKHTTRHRPDKVGPGGSQGTKQLFSALTFGKDAIPKEHAAWIGEELQEGYKGDVTAARFGILQDVMAGKAEPSMICLCSASALASLTETEQKAIAKARYGATGKQAEAWLNYWHAASTLLIANSDEHRGISIRHAASGVSFAELAKPNADDAD